MHVLCGEPREHGGQEQEGGESGAVAVSVLNASEEGEPSGYQDGGKRDGCSILNHVWFEQWKLWDTENLKNDFSGNYKQTLEFSTLPTENKI